MHYNGSTFRSALPRMRFPPFRARHPLRPWSTRRRAWLALLGFAVLVALRAWLVDARIGAYTDCTGCTRGALLRADLPVFAVVAALLGVDALVRGRLAHALLRAGAMAVVLYHSLDLGLAVALAQRLHLTDFLAFGGEAGAVRDFALALFRSAAIAGWLAAAALLALVLTLIATARRGRAPVAALGFLGVAGLTGVAAVVTSGSGQYVHPELVQNIFAINAPSGADAAYSPGFVAALPAAPAPTACARDAAARRPDVILVAVESLSAYHSALLGGPLDVTPELDALAREHHYFTHFVANGFTTNGGRVALYTGRAPLPAPGFAATQPLSAWSFRSGTLPELARQAGYTSHYFTTGTLGFLDSGPWLRALGFDSVEGAESPYYAGMRRWQFDAAPDAALFDRLLAWLDERREERPFLAALLTVTGHPPFVNPETGRIDQEGTFRYVDAQLGRLERELRARGFFANGVLLITGDHRAMTPLRAEEYRRWGERALMRIPMVVVGAVDMPPVVEATFAQTDVAPSFAWLAGLDTCLDPAHGNFARPAPRPPAWVLHADGSRRNQVLVVADGQLHAITLDGDATRWEGEPPAHGERILQAVNRQRIRERELGTAAVAPTP